MSAVLRSGVTGLGPASYKWLGMLIGSQMGQGELNESYLGLANYEVTKLPPIRFEGQKGQ